MRVLAAGDHFVRPDLIDAALCDALSPDLSADLEVRELTLPWPHEPFGPVGGVEEASGTEEHLIEMLEGAEICVTQMAPSQRRFLPPVRIYAWSRYPGAAP